MRPSSESKVRATRNYQPLPFRHLDPKRFEDLVRQLAYDFRDWKSIEATGRTGSDLGMDVRAVEIVPKADRAGVGEDEDDLPAENEERVWVIQCKREQTFGPKRVRQAVAESVDRLEQPPYGFILATSADLSVAARQALREEMGARGVQEFYAWGAGEIEDRLYQPRNDGLLFAYFGISLQVRRRSKRTELRTDLTLKRQLVRALGPIGESGGPVLIRGAHDDRYPYIASDPGPGGPPTWRYFTFHGHEPPGHVMFEIHQHWAYIDRQQGQWDHIHDYDLACVSYPELFQGAEESTEEREFAQRCARFWSDLPPENQAIFHVYGVIPYERILAVDELGDAYNQGPHLLIESLPDGLLFERKLYFKLSPEVRFPQVRIDLFSEDTRIGFFLDEIPASVEKEPPPDLPLR